MGPFRTCLTSGNQWRNDSWWWQQILQISHYLNISCISFDLSWQIIDYLPISYSHWFPDEGWGYEIVNGAVVVLFWSGPKPWLEWNRVSGAKTKLGLWFLGLEDFRSDKQQMTHDFKWLRVTVHLLFWDGSPLLCHCICVHLNYHGCYLPSQTYRNWLFLPCNSPTGSSLCYWVVTMWHQGVTWQLNTGVTSRRTP